jgi:hypothetical protein
MAGRFLRVCLAVVRIVARLIGHDGVMPVESLTNPNSRAASQTARTQRWRRDGEAPASSDRRGVNRIESCRPLGCNFEIVDLPPVVEPVSKLGLKLLLGQPRSLAANCSGPSQRE